MEVQFWPALKSRMQLHTCILDKQLADEQLVARRLRLRSPTCCWNKSDIKYVQSANELGGDRVHVGLKPQGQQPETCDSLGYLTACWISTAGTVPLHNKRRTGKTRTLHYIQEISQRTASAGRDAMWRSQSENNLFSPPTLKVTAEGVNKP